MEALSLLASIPPACTPRSQRVRCIETTQFKNYRAKNFHNQLSPMIHEKFTRRLLLQFMGLSSVIYHVDPNLAVPNPQMTGPEIIWTLKLESGVRIQEVVEGEGSEAHEGDLVEINYVCRRRNGYFVYSTVDQFSGESTPAILRLEDSQIIKGLKEVLVGMKVGGKRRALIPPSVGYLNESLQPIPDEFGPRRSLLSHADEPLVFEAMPLLSLISSCTGNVIRCLFVLVLLIIQGILLNVFID